MPRYLKELGSNRLGWVLHLDRFTNELRTPWVACSYRPEDPEVLAHLPASQRPSGLPMGVHRIRRVKVLAGVFWHPVTKGNCVAARRGGEQPEVNNQSVTQVNSIRPTVVASLLLKGEAQMTQWLSEGGDHETRGPVSPTQETPETRRGGSRWLETE